MEKHTAQRNTQVDMLRGIAMLLVVLGHTLSGCTTEYQTSFVYEVIWALQMPLFVLISGYVTRYSRPASDPVSLLVLLGRRTLAYLLPWTVWTFLVRGLIFGDEGFLDLRHIFYSMDSGYWFLFTIWTISVIFALARFVSSCILRGRGNAAVDTLLVGGFYILGMGLLAVLGKLTDMSFLCIKLTLYYMPFFFAGYLFGRFSEWIMGLRYGRIATDAVSAVCLGVFIYLLNTREIYNVGDSLTGIIVRAATSLAGCVAVCGLFRFITGSFELLNRALTWVGVHSLEVYLVHYLLLGIVRPTELPALSSHQGMLTALVNFAVTVILSVLVIRILNHSETLRLVLFGKLPKRKQS